jgi:hypothetical protein
MSDAQDAPTDGQALGIERKKVFLLLRRRLRYLHFNRPLPASSGVGSDYIADATRIDCAIRAHFVCPGFVRPFEFWFHGTKVTGAQAGNILQIVVQRKIPLLLWDHLRLMGVGQEYLIGYITTLMPRINRRLIDNRYEEGHLLSRTFAIFEAMGVNITVKNRALQLDWPRGIASFPPSRQLSDKVTALYVRDYIDAMHAFFRNEYDDCIRRVITATENFIETKEWKVKRSSSCIFFRLFPNLPFLKPKKGDSFRRKLSDNLDKTKIAGQVINENLQFIYTIRNKIVHGGFRISTNSGMFCDKAVSTLYYLIYRHSGDRKVSRYVQTLNQQFLMQKGFLGQLHDLDEIEALTKKEQSANQQVIDSHEVLESSMFGALRLTDNDKHNV